MTRILPLTQTTDPATVAGQALVYAKNIGGVARAFCKNGDGTITPVDGGGNFALPEVWAYPDVAASLTDAVMSPQVSGFANETRMARSGSIIGVVAQLSEAITAGSLTVKVTKNGTPVTLNAVLTTGTGGQASQASGVDTYVAGDLIGVKITTNSGFLPITTDLEVWVEVAEGVSSPGPSSGGIIPWVAGSYIAGQTVTRGPYVWTALAPTSEDPFLVEGNLGSNSDWTFATGGSPGTTQTSGASDGAPNGKILLINNVAGSSVTAYRQSVNSGFLGKMLAVDLQISGTADWLYFGLFDSSLAQTASDLLITTGFYGVNVFIYTPSTAKIENIINGTPTGNVAYANADSTNAGSAFSRWFLRMIQNGSNWDLEVLRPARIAGASLPYSGFDAEQEDDLVPIARFTNVARPSFTNWRFVVGARTGGSAGIFSCRAAYVRDILSGAWAAVAKRPTGLG